MSNETLSKISLTPQIPETLSRIQTPINDNLQLNNGTMFSINERPQTTRFTNISDMPTASEIIQNEEQSFGRSISPFSRRSLSPRMSSSRELSDRQTSNDLSRQMTNNATLSPSRTSQRDLLNGSLSNRMSQRDILDRSTSNRMSQRDLSDRSMSNRMSQRDGRFTNEEIVSNNTVVTSTLTPKRSLTMSNDNYYEGQPSGKSFSETYRNITNENLLPAEPTLREQSLREQSLREQSMGGQSMINQSSRDQSLRNQSLRDQSLRDQSLRNQQLKAESLREQSLRTQALRDQTLREQSLRTQALRDQTLREQSLERSRERTFKGVSPFTNSNEIMINPNEQFSNMRESERKSYANELLNSARNSTRRTASRRNLTIPSNNLGKGILTDEISYVDDIESTEKIIPLTNNQELVINNEKYLSGSRHSLKNGSNTRTYNNGNATFRVEGESTVENRSDEYMELLLKEKGIMIDSRLYMSEDGLHMKPYYLSATTNYGDKFFIKLDSKEYQDTFPSITDIELNSNPNNSLIYLQKSDNAINLPQQTVINKEECELTGVCGSAFTCADGLCFTNKTLVSTAIPFEEHYNVNGDLKLPVGTIGYSALSYPIVTMSSALTNGDLVSDINKYSNSLRRASMPKLLEQGKKYNDELDKLASQKESTKALMNGIGGKGGLLDEINVLNEKLKDPKILANEEQVKIILNKLKEKKAIVDRSITELSNIYAQRPLIENIETNSSSKLATTISDTIKTLGGTDLKTITKTASTVTTSTKA